MSMERHSRSLSTPLPYSEDRMFPSTQLSFSPNISQVYTKLSNCITDVITDCTHIDGNLKQYRRATRKKGKLLDFLDLRYSSRACVHEQMCAGIVAILNLSSTFLGPRQDYLDNWLLADLAQMIGESALHSRIMVVNEFFTAHHLHDSIVGMYKLKRLDLALMDLSFYWIDIDAIEKKNAQISLAWEAFLQPPLVVILGLFNALADERNTTQRDTNWWLEYASQFHAMFCTKLSFSSLDTPGVWYNGLLLGSWLNRHMTGTFIDAVFVFLSTNMHYMTATYIGLGTSLNRIGGLFTPALLQLTLIKVRWDFTTDFLKSCQ